MQLKDRNWYFNIEISFSEVRGEHSVLVTTTVLLKDLFCMRMEEMTEGYSAQLPPTQSKKKTIVKELNSCGFDVCLQSLVFAQRERTRTWFNSFISSSWRKPNKCEVVENKDELAV